MLYCFWDMARDRCNFYFSFLSIFCPFTPLQPKNWKFQKNENTPGDNIVLHKCTKNHDQMLYCSWDMVHDWYNCYFSFRVIPPSHTHPHTHTQFQKNENKNIWEMLYCSWDMVHDGCNCDFSFRAIFCPFTPLIKISKKMLKVLEISSFYTCALKIMIRWCTNPEIWNATDGRIEKVT